MESAGNLSHCADVDRPCGNATGEAEFDDDSKTSVKVPAIYRFQDHEFYDCKGAGLLLWEFYSAQLSKEAGKHVGLGTGWRLENSYLREKHAFGSAKQPKATLRHNDYDFKTGATTTNVLGLASHKQRKAAQATALAQRSEAKIDVFGTRATTRTDAGKAPQQRAARLR